MKLSIYNQILKKQDETEQKLEAQNKYFKQVQNAFLSNQTISNDDFLKLCDLHSIKIPLRTRGFFINSVKDICLVSGNNNVTYYYRKGTRSKRAYDVIEELRDFLFAQNADSQ